MKKYQSIVYNLLGSLLLISMGIWFGLNMGFNDRFFSENQEPIQIKIDPISHQPINYDIAEYNSLMKARKKVSLFGYYSFIILLLWMITWYYWIVPNNSPLKKMINDKIKEGGNDE